MTVPGNATRTDDALGEIAAGRPIRLTHPQATRFWMTRQEAVDLVMCTAETMCGGELVIPDLPAYELSSLVVAMGREAGLERLDVNVVGLGDGEKMHESMRPGETSQDARRMTVDEIKEGLTHV